VFAFEHPERLDPQQSVPIPAKQNPANLQSTAGNGEERLHDSQADLVEHPSGILDREGALRYSQ
jgi:hypothetical protein